MLDKSASQSRSTPFNPRSESLQPARSVLRPAPACNWLGSSRNKKTARTRSLVYPRWKPFTIGVKNISVRCDAVHVHAPRFELTKMGADFLRTEVSHEAPNDLWPRGGRPACCRNHHPVVAHAFDRQSRRICGPGDVARPPHGGRLQQGPDRGLSRYVAGLFDRDEALRR